jgi:polyisoprenoid-binding protein YceI
VLGLAAALFISGIGPSTGRAAQVYAIDQTFGDIGFAVHHLGLFASRGQFRQFTGTLTIDEAHPERTQVNVVIDLGSVTMSWSDAEAMVRSAPFFDVEHYPQARFVSSDVASDGASAYVVHGALALRGQTHPVTLRATLTGRHPAPLPGQQIADFIVTGALSRAAFGMTSEPVFISDKVDLQIHARVLLTEPAHAG